VAIIGYHNDRQLLLSKGHSAETASASLIFVDRFRVGGQIRWQEQCLGTDPPK
jgi:hypothetical protein